MLIGVYCNRKHPLDFMKRERVEVYLKEAAARSIGLYFFTIDDVDFNSQKINGRWYDRGNWVEKVSDFPDLVMNESNESGKKFRDPELEQVLRNRLTFLSHLIENKIIIHEKLESTGHFTQLLIPTFQLNGIHDFLNLIEKEKTIILKPVSGSKGQGIVVVKKTAAGQFLFFQNEHKQKHHTLSAKSVITQMMKQRPYIMQPFIISRTSEGYTFHMRVHLMRNGQGKWAVLAVLADIAETGRLISNYREVKTIWGHGFLKSNFGESGEKLFEDLTHQATRIADQIDSFYPYTIDELAIDLAIDQHQNIRFFEANTGPEIITFSNYREQQRAKHKFDYVTTIINALKNLPKEERRGRFFKIGAR